ncbi:hypothetical protein I8F73_05195 [Enterococcus faecalis]|nr:hypothetical protein [Enterococcus faecalis]
MVGTDWRERCSRKAKINKGTSLWWREFGLMFLEGDQTFSKLGTAVQMSLAVS